MKEYLELSIKENTIAVGNYIKKGYFGPEILDKGSSTKIDAITEVFSDLIKTDPGLILKDVENSYVAAIRTLGDKCDEMFKQVDYIRSCNKWKK